MKYFAGKSKKKEGKGLDFFGELGEKLEKYKNKAIKYLKDSMKREYLVNLKTDEIIYLDKTILIDKSNGDIIDIIKTSDSYENTLLRNRRNKELIKGKEAIDKAFLNSFTLLYDASKKKWAVFNNFKNKIFINGNKAKPKLEDNLTIYLPINDGDIISASKNGNPLFKFRESYFT